MSSDQLREAYRLIRDGNKQQPSASCANGARPAQQRRCVVAAGERGRQRRPEGARAPAGAEAASGRRGGAAVLDRMAPQSSPFEEDCRRMTSSISTPRNRSLTPSRSASASAAHGAAAR